MAIQSIDEAGNLTWKCPHWPEEADAPCGTVHSDHISHIGIQWCGHPGAKPEHRTVSLPPCSACGAVTFLKVAFTEKELKAPNMWQAWNSNMEAGHQKAKDFVAHPESYPDDDTSEQNLALLKHQIEQAEIIRQAGGYHTDSHAMALRHVELARQLIASGKIPKQGEQNSAES